MIKKGMFKAAYHGLGFQVTRFATTWYIQVVFLRYVLWIDTQHTKPEDLNNGF